VNDLGWSLYKAGKIDEARPALERAVAMDPTDAQPRRTSGYVGVPMVLRAGHAAAGASRLQVLGLRADRRARYRAHTGFVNPEAPPDAVPRESIEVRTVALFAD